MSSVPKALMTPEEYLAHERQAEYKSEFFRGELFAMAGASAKHNLIVLNTGAALREHLRDEPCRVYASDLKLKVEATDLFTYPDVTVVCGPPRFLDEHSDVLLNPLVLVEVLSDSTEAYDRGKKFEHYRQIPSLRHYVLIAQDRVSVEIFSLADDGLWLMRSSQQLTDSLRLEAIQGLLHLAEVYAKVEFDPEESPSAESPTAEPPGAKRPGADSLG